MENIIISGLQTKRASYSNASKMNTQHEEGINHEESETLEEQVVKFISDKVTKIHPMDISACHLLPPNKNPNAAVRPRNIIVRLTSRKTKNNIMKNAKHLSEYNRTNTIKVGINEHLTQHNAELFKMAREHKKLNRISSAFTKNCRVLIKTAGTNNENQTIHHITSKADFEKYIHVNIASEQPNKINGNKHQNRNKYGSANEQ